MQSMTRSVSLTFAAAANPRRYQNEQIEAFEGETAALKHFCLPVRSYGTCGDFASPYVPSPSRKCVTHIVAQHETLAGIALKYDITVEDLRRTNSFLWTSNSVWVGQVIKVPVIKERHTDPDNAAKKNEISKGSSLSSKRKESSDSKLEWGVFQESRRDISRTYFSTP